MHMHIIYDNIIRIVSILINIIYINYNIVTLHWDSSVMLEY